MTAERIKRVEETVDFKGMSIVVKRYMVDAQGRKQGQYEEMDIHGCVVKKGMYENDQLHGLLEIRKDSKNYQIISYKRGKKDGIFVEYQNDLLVRRGSYHNDQLVREDRFQYKGEGCRHISEWYDSWIDTVHKGEKPIAKSLADRLSR